MTRHDPDNAIAGFLNALAAERGASRNTLDAYRRDLADYERALSREGRGPVGAEREDIERYLAGLISDGLAVSTRARRLSAIRQFHGFLYTEGWREDDPAARIPGPGKPQRLPKTLTLEEVKRLLAAAQSGSGIARARRVCLMELLYATGLRVTELVSLPVAAARRDPEALIVTGKGEVDRMVPLSRRAREALAEYLPLRDAAEKPGRTASRYLFPSRGKDGHLTRVRFFQIVREIAVQAGLDPAKVSPHTLRHAFATHLLANGADLRVIQTLLGHADIATTEIYTHVVDEDLKTLVFEHHPLARKGDGE